MERVSGEVFGRDRQEVEAQVDFHPDSHARRIMDDDEPHTGPELWKKLDLSDLERLDWTDDQLTLLLAFEAPIHPEKRDNGEFADRNQPFLEVYLDTEDGLLGANNLSLRTRMRPEQNRALSK